VISRLTGKLVQVGERSALLETNGLCYEVLLPSALADRLKENGSPAESITLETIYYIEAGDKKSSHFPRLVGFLDPVDREFFSLFTQVPGLGVKKALKCLILPIGEIAAAIENKNAATLQRLPGVGARLAEKIVAELNGKVAKYALSRTQQALAAQKRPDSPLFDEALEVLLQLQYARAEAEEMIGSVLKENSRIKSEQDRKGVKS
jgi:Holliday junction DNA helicase RuvA